MSTPAPQGKGRGGGAAAWLRNPRNQLIAGGVGAVAVLALYLRHKATATTGTTPGTAAGATPQTFDTSGTDIASMLSDYNAQNQAAIAQYEQQINTLLGSVGNGSASAPGSAGTTPTGTGILRGSPIPYTGNAGSVLLNPGTPGVFESVPLKGKLTLRDLAKTTGLTVADLRRINPTLAHTGFDSPLQAGKIIRIK